MEIIEARDLCASTVVTTQLPNDKIYTAFADPTLTDAICDRLFQRAIHIPLKGESRRKAAPPKLSIGSTHANFAKRPASLSSVLDPMTGMVDLLA